MVQNPASELFQIGHKSEITMTSEFVDMSNHLIFDFIWFLLSSLVTDPYLMSIVQLVLEL